MGYFDSFTCLGFSLQQPKTITGARSSRLSASVAHLPSHLHEQYLLNGYGGSPFFLRAE